MADNPCNCIVPIRSKMFDDKGNLEHVWIGFFECIQKCIKSVAPTTPNAQTVPNGITFATALHNYGWLTAENIAVAVPGSGLTGIYFYVLFVDELTADCFVTADVAVDDSATSLTAFAVTPNPAQVSTLAFAVGDWLLWNDAGQFELGQLTAKIGNNWTIRRHDPAEATGDSIFKAARTAHVIDTQIFKVQVRRFLFDATQKGFSSTGGPTRFDMNLPAACVVAVMAAPFNGAGIGDWATVNCATATVPGLRTCMGGEFSFQATTVVTDPAVPVALNHFSVDITQPQRVNFCYVPVPIATDDLIVNVNISTDEGVTWTTIEQLTVLVGARDSWPGISPPTLLQQTPYSGSWPFRRLNAGEQINFTIEQGTATGLTIKLNT